MWGTDTIQIFLRLMMKDIVYRFMAIEKHRRPVCVCVNIIFLFIFTLGRSMPMKESKNKFYTWFCRETFGVYTLHFCMLCILLSE